MNNTLGRLLGGVVCLFLCYVTGADAAAGNYGWLVVDVLSVAFCGWIALRGRR